jgi:hypothetical protein
MRIILIIAILLSVITSNAQTFCTKVIPVEEKLITTTERIMTREAITSWECISPAVAATYETITKTVVVQDGYDKLVKKNVNGCVEWCIESIAPVIEQITETILVKEPQAPIYKLVTVCPAIYKTMTITKKIKDGKVIVVTAQCN